MIIGAVISLSFFGSMIWFTMSIIQHNKEHREFEQWWNKTREEENDD